MCFIKNNERGSAILEFCLVMPVFLLIGFAGLELGDALKHIEIASMISHEAAKAAYPCTATAALPEQSRRCLEDVQAQFSPLLGWLVPGTELSLTVYAFRPNRSLEHTQQSSSASYGSWVRYRNNNFCYAESGGTCLSNHIRAPKKSVLDNHRLIVVAEAFVPYRPLMGVGGLGYFSFVRGRVYYDVTVI